MVLHHECELDLNAKDNLGERHWTIRTCGRIKNWCTITENHPKCQEYMISMTAIANERKRHSEICCWWIIHPFSYVRFLWEIIMMLIYFIAFVTIPFMICFVVLDYYEVRNDKINIFIYVVCWMDILINCISGYYDKKNREVVLQQGKILQNYLQGFLLIDTLTSLPYDHITHQWRRIPGENSSLFLAILNTVPMLKLLRYVTLNKYIRKLFMRFQTQDYVHQTLSTLLFFLYVIFWSACVCHMIPVLMMHALSVRVSDCQNCWLSKVADETIASRFRYSLFIVTENFVACGFGMFELRTEGHLVVTCILMVLGVIFQGYFIIMFVLISSGKEASESKYHEIVNQVKAYTQQKQLPHYMKKRLLAYYKYHFQNSYFNEATILSKLSASLREDVIVQSCKRLVENVAIFKNLPHKTLTSIVSNLKFELYLPNDIIVKAGSQGECMFFLSIGTVAVLTPTGKEVCHLEDGAHFGEVALIVQDQRRVATVVAIEICEIYRLERRDFRKCIAVHSELFNKIERIATERMQKTIFIEEQHKRYLLQANRLASTKRKKRKSKNGGRLGKMQHHGKEYDPKEIAIV